MNKNLVGPAIEATLSGFARFPTHECVAMVHFGRFLNSEQSRCCQDSYLGYKVLKKHVKKVCAASRAQEARELLCEPNPALDDDFEMDIAMPAALAEQGKEEFLLLFQEEIRKLNHFVIQAKSEAQTVADLEELAIFAETNRTACRKIVKKFLKKCGPSQELQLQLQRLDDEPFLASLSHELPKASIALQIRLSSAGVCQETPHDRLMQIVVHNENTFSAGSDGLQTPTEELSPSPNSPGTGAVRSALGNLIWRDILPRPGRERYVFLALLSCGVVLLGTSVVLRFIPIVTNSVVSIMCGAGLLLTLTAVITRMASFCGVIEPHTEHGHSFRHCMWQQLQYGDLCVDDFSPKFAVMKVSREEDGCAVCHVSDQVPCCPPPEPIGGAISTHVRQVSCGCCLQDFGALDDVTLLPCYHIFCTPCISSWALASAKSAHSCPICRARFSNAPCAMSTV